MFNCLVFVKSWIARDESLSHVSSDLAEYRSENDGTLGFLD